MPFAAPRRRTTLVLAVLSGLLVDLGFPGTGTWSATFAGIALLFIALGHDSARWNFLVGLVHGLAFFLPHIVWAQRAVGAVPWVALSLVEALVVALFAVAWSWARRGAVIWRSVGYQVPAFALLWTAAEEVRSVAPFGGFPWGRLAFSQAESPLARFAWLGGTPLVTALVVVVGVLAALALLAARRVDLGSASGYAVLAVLVLGSGLLIPLDTQAEEGTLEVGAVQGNVPDQGLDAFAQAREVLDNHVAGTHALLDQVEPGDLDLVLWPENGTDIDPRADSRAAADITAAARAVDAPVLVGTVHYPESGGRLNTALLWDPQDGAGVSYAKQHPAPFAEYVPMRDLARKFSAAVDRVRTDMLPGTQVGLLEVDVPRLDRTVGVGVAICFEVAYDDLVRDSVQAGAQVLVIPTNNATFGRTDESLQQLAMTRLRAIEHGRTTIQVSTVGVSGVVTPHGVLRQSTELFTADQMVTTVGLRSTLTPATRYGDVYAWAVRVLAVVVVVAGMAGAVRVRQADRITPEDLDA